MKQLLILLLLTGLFYARSSAQVSVNSDGTAPDNSAMLDIKAADKGLLIPRVALTATNIAVPITNPATSLLVYNTATAGTSPNNVTPGYYYWNGTAWNRLSVSSGGSGGWSLLGNAGTTAGTNFIGTTDNNAFDIRTNNLLRTRFTTKGAIETYNTGQSVFLGESAGSNDDLNDRRNVFVGYNTGRLTTTGYENTANGYMALFGNTEGALNVANGANSLWVNTTGNSNTANGAWSLSSNQTGYNNAALGYYTLTNNTAGYNNTGLGAVANVASSNLTNATAVGAYAMVGASNSLVLGSIAGVNYATSSVNVGIGTTTPTEKLTVSTGTGTDVKTSIVAGGEDKKSTLYLGTPFEGSLTNPFKTAIIAEGVTFYCKAKLHFCLNNANSNDKANDASVSDAKMTILADGNIGIGTTSPAASAALDITSTTKGFLPPRMTGAERNAITSAAAGLLIWCTDCGANGEMQVYNGTEWKNMIGGAVSWSCGDPLVDSRDGKSYTTISLGAQCWMAQNLNFYVGNSWCYDDNASNCDTYGRLYNWYGMQGACPSGWHLPTDIEWTTLTTYVNNQTSYRCNSTSGWIAKAMAATTLWWASSGTCAVGNDLSLNNATGFTALPGGYRDSMEVFGDVGYGGYWWSSSEDENTGAWSRSMRSTLSDVSRGGNSKQDGFSVRCLRD